MNLMYFEDLNVGDSWTSSECPVDHEEMLTYGRAYDPWPFHVNPEAAAQIAVWRINRQWRLHNQSDVSVIP